MPYKIEKRGNKYAVINAETGEVHARGTTKQKAEAQVRLLNAQDHGFKPDKTKVLSDGTRVNIRFKGKRRGKAK